MIGDLWKVLKGKLSSKLVEEQSAEIGRWIDRTSDLCNRFEKLENQIRPMLAGVGRIIAKQDPLYGTVEVDPVRRADSDKLADEVIERLKAEDMARRHTEGKL